MESPDDLREASDPGTPGSRLAQLAKHEDPWVRVRVARNPATPLEVLEVLGNKHADAVLENPILPLVLVMDPGWLARQPVPMLRELLGSDRYPGEWVESARMRWNSLEVAVHLERRDLVERWAKEREVLGRQDRAPTFFALEHDQDDMLQQLLDLGFSPLDSREFYADGNVHEMTLLEEAWLQNKDRCVRVLLATKAHRLAELTALLSWYPKAEDRSALTRLIQERVHELGTSARSKGGARPSRGKK
jgi:hypothetical protein